jgi:hypothetical protein
MELKLMPRALDGIRWRKRSKVPYSLLKLYANSGPVPVTIINKLKKFLEAQAN